MYRLVEAFTSMALADARIMAQPEVTPSPVNVAAPFTHCARPLWRKKIVTWFRGWCLIGRTRHSGEWTAVLSSPWWWWWWCYFGPKQWLVMSSLLIPGWSKVLKAKIMKMKRVSIQMRSFNGTFGKIVRKASTEVIMKIFISPKLVARIEKKREKMRKKDNTICVKQTQLQQYANT